ncbi:DUF257 family protein [Thermococcus sp. Bubb.Bath]|uniref:DUF257 family protein n=1 Tax=Thermococcus sp. Bubb.Bath TaxID=1638242 RepID=UPI00143AE1AD|nr:DUF257 family protein [Thermococcus sp. Bubb.Bath]NJF25979.1 hypothetical protein [Thermococcus sp. Bubb.Bath]
MEITQFFSKIRPGETVILEHESAAVPSYALYRLLKDATEKGNNILVDDFLDTLHVYKTHIELSGLDVSIFDRIPVIKIGGIIDIGNVVGRVSPRRGVILRKEYEKVYSEVITEEEVTINPVLGLEKILIFADDKVELMETLAQISLRLGDKRRIAIYFINKDILNEVNPVATPIIEFMSTTLVEVKKKGRVYTFEVLKSTTPEIDGMTFNYDLDKVE